MNNLRREMERHAGRKLTPAEVLALARQLGRVAPLEVFRAICVLRDAQFGENLEEAHLIIQDAGLLQQVMQWGSFSTVDISRIPPPPSVWIKLPVWRWPERAIRKLSLETPREVSWGEMREGVARSRRFRRILRDKLFRPEKFKWPRKEGHYFLECGVPLGWRVFSLDPVSPGLLRSPFMDTAWEEATLSADEYDAEDQRVHAPGVHAWGFWWGFGDLQGEVAALVAALEHVTIGEKTWRAQAAQILRLWVPKVTGERWVRAIKQRYQVPVETADDPQSAALLWAWNRLQKGQLLVEE